MMPVAVSSTAAFETTSLQEEIPAQKEGRYRLCIDFLQVILEDFGVKLSPADPLISLSGPVACCIDAHLDALSLSQKKWLLREFPAFYQHLQQQKDETAFRYTLHQFAERIGTAYCNNRSVSLLFRFHRYCHSKDLMAELYAFSLAIIESSIAKTEAQTPEQILKALSHEGGSAIRFFMSLLHADQFLSQQTAKTKALQQYLTRLESMLNIADDICDSRKDKAAGTIRLPLDLRYYTLLSRRLLLTCFGTLLRHPLMFPRHFLQFTLRYLRREMA